MPGLTCVSGASRNSEADPTGCGQEVATGSFWGERGPWLGKFRLWFIHLGR